MKQKSDKIRMCIGCGKQKNAKDMIRITKEYRTDEIIINPTMLEFGRSVYICKDKKCVESALKKKKLSNLLKKTISDEEKENIKTVLNTMVVVKQ